METRVRTAGRVCGTLLAGFLIFSHSGLSQAIQPSQARTTAPSEAGQAGEGYTLKIDSELVQLDVVVRDFKGALVTGLRAGDFSVFEDNVPQTVLFFGATTRQREHAMEAPHIESTADLDRREPGAPVTIVVLDELATRFEDEYFARYSMERYLRNQGEVLDQPMMLVARTIDRTMVLSDYTTSKKKILEALNHHLVGNDWRNDNPNFKDVQIGAAFASLIEVAKATQGHSGHKNLVWIGRGFPTLQWENLQPDQADGLKDAVARCVDLLRQARVTLYVVDPAGVQGIDGTSDENGMVGFDDPFDRAASFDTLARATGGASMHGRNDVDRLIEDAVADGETFYTLEYRPEHAGKEASAGFRNIRVVLKDATLVATSRQGYYPNPAPLVAANAKNTLAGGTVFDLASASSGLMVFDGVPLTLSRQGPSSPQVQVSFPASALGLSLSEGKLRGDVTLIALCYDINGKLLAKDGRVVSLHLSELPPGQTEDRKIQIATPITARLPIARVRIVVRSSGNAKIGADNLYFVNPNTLKDRVTGLKAH